MSHISAMAKNAVAGVSWVYESVSDCPARIQRVAVRSLGKIADSRVRMGLVVFSVLLLGSYVQVVGAQSCSSNCKSECITGIKGLKSYATATSGWYHKQVQSCMKDCCWTDAKSYSAECMSESIAGIRGLNPYATADSGWYHKQVRSCVGECSWTGAKSCTTVCVSECIAGIRGLNPYATATSGWYHKQVQSCMGDCCWN